MISYATVKCWHTTVQFLKPSVLNHAVQSQFRKASFACTGLHQLTSAECQYNKLCRQFSQTYQREYHKQFFSSKWLRRSAVFVISCGMGFFMWKKQTARCHDISVTEDKKWDGMSIKLYQYQTCPFCSKTRFFLQAYNIPYEMVEVHPIFKKEIAFAKSKKVPIVVIERNGNSSVELQDSSFIISVLGSYLINQNKSIEELMERYPRKQEVDDTGKVREVIQNRHYLTRDEEWKEDSARNIELRREEAQWRMWADDHLVHIISPNVYRSLSEAYQAFDHHVKQGRFSGTWEGFIAKYAGAFAMWMVSKKLKKRHNLNENVRVDLYKACNVWVDAIGHNRKFMGGDKPNLADISVFGVLSVMEGLDSFEDLLAHSKIKRWYYNTKTAISNHDAQKLLFV